MPFLIELSRIISDRIIGNDGRTVCFQGYHDHRSNSVLGQDQSTECSATSIFACCMTYLGPGMLFPPPSQAPFPSLLDLNGFEFESFQFERLNLQRALLNHPSSPPSPIDYQSRPLSWPTHFARPHSPPIMGYSKTISNAFARRPVRLSESLWGMSPQYFCANSKLSLTPTSLLLRCSPCLLVVHSAATLFHFRQHRYPHHRDTPPTTSVPNDVIVSSRRRSASGTSNLGMHVFLPGRSTVLEYIT
jgi:hypothetical protein